MICLVLPSPRSDACFMSRSLSDGMHMQQTGASICHPSRYPVRASADTRRVIARTDPGPARLTRNLVSPATDLASLACTERFGHGAS